MIDRESCSVALIALWLALSPVARADTTTDELYKKLIDSKVLDAAAIVSQLGQEEFESRRTETGVDFSSKEQIKLNGEAHPRFHFEIEGPLPVPNVKNLKEAVDLLATIVKPEVEASHEEKNTVIPGLGVAFVKVGGTTAAFLRYKNSREPDTFGYRAIMYQDGQIYSLSMSLHSVPENDRHGILLPAVVIEMVKLGFVAPSPGKEEAAKPSSPKR